MMKKSTNMTRQVEEKAIEEMAKLCPFYEEGKCLLLEEDAVECDMNCDMCRFAKTLYNADYRKQSENTIDLPCKVGDTVWYISKRENEEEANVHQGTARCIDIRSTGSHVILHWVSEDDENIHKVFARFSDFGVSAFLVKDEAEKALANMKGGKQNVSL